MHGLSPLRKAVKLLRLPDLLAWLVVCTQTAAKFGAAKVVRWGFDQLQLQLSDATQPLDDLLGMPAGVAQQLLLELDLPN